MLNLVAGASANAQVIAHMVCAPGDHSCLAEGACLRWQRVTGMGRCHARVEGSRGAVAAERWSGPQWGAGLSDKGGQTGGLAGAPQLSSQSPVSEPCLGGVRAAVGIPPPLPQHHFTI